MATLKEFEEALRLSGMTHALAILESLKKRDREKRSVSPARRVVGKKMTTELARAILDFHSKTGMTQQEIAFKLGVNQGRVNEVIKRGKWLSMDPMAPEIMARDKAIDRLNQRALARRAVRSDVMPDAVRPLAPADRQAAAPRSAKRPSHVLPAKPRIISAQLAFIDL